MAFAKHYGRNPENVMETSEGRKDRATGAIMRNVNGEALGLADKVAS